MSLTGRTTTSSVQSICPPSAVLPQATALEVRAEEVLGAGGRHRRRRGDLEREGRGGDDLREAVDLAGAGAVHELEPLPRRRQRRAAADRPHLEAGEADGDVQAAVDAPSGA